MTCLARATQEERRDLMLMEQAAKAIGLSVIGPYMPNHDIDGLNIVPSGERWNPLEDDGDALRLAVNLGLVVDAYAMRAISATRLAYGHNDWVCGLDEDDDDMDEYEATRRAIVRALKASAMVVPDGLALMPRALTAENGAKAAMLGEFAIRLERHCSSCVDEAGDLSCDECGGDVEYVESVSVDWPTIKDIYAKAVDLLAASPTPGDSK